ncbi:MAG TPA: hypothetical protein VG870_01025 [Chitinophagaceae bacterium]|nr:hypothetical protein [Chitinophagaceae bacterium]
MERGFDPEVIKYFKKIISSFSMGMCWLLANMTAGLYFGLAIPDAWPRIDTILFYAGFLLSLLALLWYLYRTWKK